MGTNQEHNRLSVIIPTLNEAEILPQLLAALRGAPIVREVIVVDGGSSDETLSMARAAGVRVITASRGRGTQLAAGAAAAAGEWFLFLHADCRLEARWEAAVRVFLAAPEVAGRAGYFHLKLDDASPAARRIERLVAWRCRFLALPYGDQGLLIARPLYDRVGGFAPLALMEDVDFVRRLGRRRLAPIGGHCTASARRYQSGGYWRQPVRNLCCLFLFYVGVAPDRILRFYG